MTCVCVWGEWQHLSEFISPGNCNHQLVGGDQVIPNLSHVPQDKRVSVQVEAIVKVGQQVWKHESCKVGSTCEVSHSVGRVYHSSERTDS